MEPISPFGTVPKGEIGSMVAARSRWRSG